MNEINRIEIVKRGNRSPKKADAAAPGAVRQNHAGNQREIAGRVTGWVRDFKEQKRAEKLLAREIVRGRIAAFGGTA